MAGQDTQIITKLSPGPVTGTVSRLTSETITSAAVGGADPRPAAVTFITTEHFTLQGARAATIAESTGRATMFLGSVSAGLVALGLIATATRLGAMFYAFGVIVLATLSFVGLVTFERVLQSGIEDHGYAQRIARLRAFYFDCAPELTGYLASVPPPQRLAIQGLDTGHWRGSRTIAGMVGVVTAVLAGSGAGLTAAAAADHSAAAGFATGGVVALAAVLALMSVQDSAWEQTRQHPYFDCRGVAVPQLAANSTSGDGHRPGQGPRRDRSPGQPPIAVNVGPASRDGKSRGTGARADGLASRDDRRPCRGANPESCCPAGRIRQAAQRCPGCTGAVPWRHRWRTRSLDPGRPDAPGRHGPDVGHGVEWPRHSTASSQAGLMDRALGRSRQHRPLGQPSPEFGTARPARRPADVLQSCLHAAERPITDDLVRHSSSKLLPQSRAESAIWRHAASESRLRTVTGVDLPPARK